MSVFLSGAVSPAAAQTEESRETAQVLLVGIRVTPPSPSRETLCRLVATVENRGDQPVYSFGFDVELNGQPLRVYERQLFLQVIEPGDSDEVALYNFWTSETGRPAPADGLLEVAVRLREARWVQVSIVEEDGESVEVWTPVGDVDGLPQTVRRTLELR